MADNKIIIQLVISPGCTHCAEVRKVLDELKPKYPAMQVEELDATTEKGMELVVKYSIMASPGTIVNGELFAAGGINKDSLVKKLDSIKN
jgi:glutaredoxin